MSVSKRVRVEVTAEDIRKGKAGSPSACPVARAIRRAFRARSVSVICIGTVRGQVFFFYAGIESLVIAIDDRAPVKPFAFTLKLPKETP